MSLLGDKCTAYLDHVGMITEYEIQSWRIETGRMINSSVFNSDTL